MMHGRCLQNQGKTNPESLRDGVEILDRRARRDTKLTTVSEASDVAVSQVLEKMVGDTGIEPVASSV